MPFLNRNWWYDILTLSRYMYPYSNQTTRTRTGNLLDGSKFLLVSIRKIFLTYGIGKHWSVWGVMTNLETGVMGVRLCVGVKLNYRIIYHHWSGIVKGCFYESFWTFNLYFFTRSFLLSKVVVPLPSVFFIIVIFSSSFFFLFFLFFCISEFSLTHIRSACWWTKRADEDRAEGGAVRLGMVMAPAGVRSGSPRRSPGPPPILVLPRSPSPRRGSDLLATLRSRTPSPRRDVTAELRPRSRRGSAANSPVRGGAPLLVCTPPDGDSKVKKSKSIQVQSAVISLREDFCYTWEATT